MTPDTIPQSVLFPDLFDKPLVATFNQEHARYSVTGCGTDFLQWKWAEMDRAAGEVAA